VTDLHRRNQLLSLRSEPYGLSRITIADDADLFVEAEYRSVIVNRALDLLQTEFHESTCRLFGFRFWTIRRPPPSPNN
jgi:hypothetical protein